MSENFGNTVTAKINSIADSAKSLVEKINDAIEWVKNQDCPQEKKLNALARLYKMKDDYSL